MIMTDKAPGYKTIPDIEDGTWNHLSINHSRGQYRRKVVRNSTGEIININTNGIEGFWSVAKRGVRGTYIHISKKYMQHYFDEFSFRQNHRNENIFKAIIERMFFNFK